MLVRVQYIYYTDREANQGRTKIEGEGTIDVPDNLDDDDKLREHVKNEFPSNYEIGKIEKL